jgi:hypothetical protein
MAVEGASERMTSFAATPDLGPLLHVLLALQHDFILIGRTAPLPTIAQSRLPPALARVAALVPGCLHGAGAQLMARQHATGWDGVDAAIADFVVEATALGRESVTRDLPSAATERIFALAFALEQLRRNLHLLEQSVAAFARSRVTHPPAEPKRKQPA